MRKIFIPVGVFLSFVLISCNMATPENYFDRSVLAVNMLVGFAGEQPDRQLEQPSSKMVDPAKPTETVPMKRKELIDNKIAFIEDNYKKVKDLKETDETKNLLQASLALHEFVLPVYKNEYQQLAKLYDDSAPKEQVDALYQQIHTKYGARFEELYNNLTNAGKPYAEKNNIKVNWGN